MKKILALLLSLSMAFCLAACSSSGDSGASDDGSSGDGQTQDNQSADEGGSGTQDAESSGGEDSGDAGDAIEVDPLNIAFSSTFYETETGGIITQYFIDQLSELSGGAITVQPYWGGTLFSDSDILEGLSSNAVNMTTFGHMPHTGTLNYLAFPGFAPESPELALEMFNEVCFNNPETSALVQGELAEHNIYFIPNGALPGGANAFCTTYEFTDLDSMISGSASFGNMDAAIFEALGFQVTAIGPGDCYDALQRGLIDATQMGLTPMVSMQWYDVAPFWALDGTYTAGNFIAANLDWWNGLTAAQQEVIQKATDATVAFSLDMYSNGTDEEVATVEAATGNSFVQFSDEDVARIWAADFEAKADAAMTTATSNGKAEGMTKILEVCADVTHYDWQH